MNKVKLAAYRVSDEYQAWLVETARRTRRTVSQLLDYAVAQTAQAEGWGTPPDRCPKDKTN